MSLNSASVNYEDIEDNDDHYVGPDLDRIINDEVTDPTPLNRERRKFRCGNCLPVGKNPFNKKRWISNEASRQLKLEALKQKAKQLENATSNNQLGTLNNDGSNMRISTTVKSKDNDNTSNAHVTYWQRFLNIFWEYYLLFAMIIMILLALPYPYLGTSNGPLQTKWSVSYGLNILMFFFSGLSLKTEEFYKALVGIKLNFCIQLLTFGIVPLLFWAVYLLLRYLNFNRQLSDGLFILGSLPMTVNMCYVLTASAHGDDSSALLNATLGNVIGTFISPAFIFGVLNVSGDTSSGEASYQDVILKLVYKILIPLFVGQICVNAKIDFIQSFVRLIKPRAKRINENLLALIIWSSFSNTFYSKPNLPYDQLLIILALVVAMQILVYLLNWAFYSIPFLRFTAKQRVAGFFTSSSKTLVMGIPLISAIFEDDPNMGIYQVPILMYQPCLMLSGSILVPILRKFILEAEAAKTETSEDHIELGNIYPDNAADSNFMAEDNMANTESNRVPGQDNFLQSMIQVVQGYNYFIGGEGSQSALIAVQPKAKEHVQVVQGYKYTIQTA